MTHKIYLFHDVYLNSFEKVEKEFAEIIRNEERFTNRASLQFLGMWDDVMDEYPRHTPWVIELIENFLLRYPDVEWVEIKTLTDPAYYIYETQGIEHLVTMDMMCDADSPTEI